MCLHLYLCVYACFPYICVSMCVFEGVLVRAPVFSVFKCVCLW